MRKSFQRSPLPPEHRLPCQNPKTTHSRWWTALRLGGALAEIVGALVGVPTAARTDVFLDEYRVKATNRVRSLGGAGRMPQPHDAGSPRCRDRWRLLCNIFLA